MHSPFNTADKSVRRAGIVFSLYSFLLITTTVTSLSTGTRTQELQTRVLEPTQVVLKYTLDLIKTWSKLYREASLTEYTHLEDDANVNINTTNVTSITNTANGQKQTITHTKTYQASPTQPVTTSKTSNQTQDSINYYPAQNSDYSPPDWFIQKNEQTKQDFEALSKQRREEFDNYAAQSKTDFETAKAKAQAEFEAIKQDMGL